MIFVKDSEDRYVRVDGGVPVTWEVRDLDRGVGGRYEVRVNGGPGAGLRAYNDVQEARTALADLIAVVASKVHQL